MREDHDRWMRLALQEAVEAGAAGEVPVGALVVREGRVLSRGRNRTHADSDPAGHAEMIALREAAHRTGDWRLLDATLYVTLEPCAMCAGVIVLSRIPRLVFGAYDPKAGMCGSLENLVQDPRLNHRVELLGGVQAERCGALLREFFRNRRKPPSGGALR
jgi:tRNA(adenine34) deaminase